MTETLEKLFTPKELDEKKIISTVKQWQERKSGRLQCYRIGKKILYSEQHLRDYFEQSEKQPE